MAVITGAGRPAYVVNVEVYLHRSDGRWLLIRRGEQEAHAPGTLGGPGGKVEVGGAEPITDLIELTARREVREEVGVDLTGIHLSYVESTYFMSDDGDPVVNLAVLGTLPAGARPHPASAEEVAAVVWLSAAEALADPACPPWTRRAIGKAERLRSGVSG